MLQAWNSVDGMEWLNETVEAMASHPGWANSTVAEGGEYLDDIRCSNENVMPSTVELATSMYAFAERQTGATEGSARDRTEALYKWYEAHAVVSEDSSTMYYGPSTDATKNIHHEEVLNAALLTASMAAGNGALDVLFSEKAVALFDKSLPRLVSVPRPAVLVRLAKWNADDGALVATLVPRLDGVVGAAPLVISVGPGRAIGGVECGGHSVEAVPVGGSKDEYVVNCDIGPDDTELRVSVVAA